MKFYVPLILLCLPFGSFAWKENSPTFGEVGIRYICASYSARFYEDIAFKIHENGLVIANENLFIKYKALYHDKDTQVCVTQNINTDVGDLCDVTMTVPRFLEVTHEEEYLIAIPPFIPFSDLFESINHCEVCADTTSLKKVLYAMEFASMQPLEATMKHNPLDLQNSHKPEVRTQNIPIILATSSCDVYVRNLEDTSSSSVACDSSADPLTPLCNLRSAVAFSLLTIDSSPGTDCFIHLPLNKTMFINTQYGDIEVAPSGSGGLYVLGNSSTITHQSDPSLDDTLGNAPERLFTISTTTQLEFHFQIENVVISSFFADDDGFGGESGYGGVLYMTEVSSASLQQVTFRNNRGTRGGDIYMTDCSNIVISDCVFEGSESESGAAIYIGRGSADISISRVSFVGTWVEGDGGSVLIDQGVSDVTISDSLFHDSYARSRGGSIHIGESTVDVSILRCVFNFSLSDYGTGGAISVSLYNTQLTIDDCIFIECKSSSGGAIILKGISTDVIITNSSFIDCLAELGGAIQLDYDNEVLVDGCIFSGNRAGAINMNENNKFRLYNSRFVENLNLGDDMKGGAISIDVDSFTEIFNCTFERNVADSGGALWVEVGSEQTVIFGSTFEANAGSLGGAIYLPEFFNGLLVSNCVFVGNAAETGGAIYVSDSSAEVTIENSDFVDNMASTGGGGIFIGDWGSDVKVLNSQLKGCHSTEYGGGISLRTGISDVELSSVLFDSCHSGVGGGLHAFRYVSRLDVTDNVFTSNWATECGGGVYFEGLNTDATFDACHFLNNTAQQSGGGVFLHDSNINFKFSSCQFSSNIAYVDGGGLYADQLNEGLTVTVSNFTDCWAARTGGGLYVNYENDKFTVSKSSFSHNDANKGVGGGISINSQNDDALIENSTFYDNYADQNGGAVFVNKDNIRLVIIFSNFQKNEAYVGGGALSLKSNNIEANIAMCQFIANSAVSAGGSIFSALENFDMTIRGCLFRGSGAVTGGALYFGDGHSNCYIVNCIMDNNVAKSWGGALYISHFNTWMEISSTVFEANMAGSYGGAVLALGTGTFLEENTFVYNHAQEGGAVYLGGAFSEIVYSQFFSNYASDIGGAVFFTVSFSSYILESLFNANRASRGAAIAVDDSYQTSFYTVNIFNNTATDSGGGIYETNNKETSIVESLITRNVAKDGAATFSMNSVYTTIDSGKISDHVSANSGSSYFQNCVNASVRECTFNNNTAGLSGGAIHTLSTTGFTIADNTFQYNTAVSSGGGAVFYLAASMDCPDDLLSSNIYNDNRAAYGANMATEGSLIKVRSDSISDVGSIRRLLLDNNGSNEVVYFNVTSYYAPVNPVYVSLRDSFDQVVLTDSQTVLQVSVTEAYATVEQCYDGAGYVSGGIFETLADGIANFSSLLSYCAPDYSLQLNVTGTTAFGVSLSTAFGLSFRPCERGEVYYEKSCRMCGEGKYSLVEDVSLSTTECKECPNGASGCYGDVINVKKGYWRVSDTATTILKCPRDKESCTGGVIVGEALCEEGYEGPLCAVCADNYYLQTSTNTCEKCSSIWVWSDPFVIVVLVLLFLSSSFVLFIGCRCHHFSNNKMGSVDDFLLWVYKRRIQDFDTEKQNEEDMKFRISAIRKFILSKLKVLLVFYQIVSSFPYVIQFEEMPVSFTSVVSVFNVLNVDFMNIGGLSCNGGSLDFVDKLVIRTLYPVGVLGFITLGRILHARVIREKETPIIEIKRIKSLYFAMALLFLYVILPGVSTTIFQTFSCKNTDPDDVESGGDSYFMTADYSVSCSSSKYDFAVIWASCMIAIYPIGVPCFFLYLLHSHRSRIENRVVSTFGTLSVSQDLAFDPLRLFYETYLPRCWYWEVVETAQRLVLTGFLVLVRQGSLFQIIFAIGATAAFIKLNEFQNPYINSSVGRSKELTLWQILIMYFLVLLLKVGYGGDHNKFIGVAALIVLFVNIIVEVCYVLYIFLREYASSHKNSGILGATDRSTSISNTSRKPGEEILTEVELKQRIDSVADCGSVHSLQSVDEETGNHCDSKTTKSPIYSRRT